MSTGSGQQSMRGALLSRHVSGCRRQEQASMSTSSHEAPVAASRMHEEVVAARSLLTSPPRCLARTASWVHLTHCLLLYRPRRWRSCCGSAWVWTRPSSRV